MKTAVIGIGNILQKDDGIGIWVIREFMKEGIEGVEIIDGGTAVYDLISTFMKYNRLIIVDSLKAGHEPGTIYRLTLKELKWREGKSSLHEIHFLDVLKMLQKLGHNPDVVVIGMEPKEICYQMGLSEELEEKIPYVIEIIKEEISNFNIRRTENA
ncbi:hypothetical protein BBF96_05785 [Anoxybacter fermentans]|uniref:Hydrogenase maturation protease n=1 Tax=Anoxybacter fermentans TaxID=1323375 RepID=A0A3Q9HRK7_9FIRM|nr:hydrogenase maturation protease [Anoxybacter fermentans]AZR72945.1 hypothetical protein BBF96_05785 [Anoxybacter fermentans]